MKKIIAIAAVVTSAQTFAFWGWNDTDGYTGGSQDSRGNASGDAVMDMESMFSAVRLPLLLWRPLWATDCPSLAVCPCKITRTENPTAFGVGFSLIELTIDA